MHLCYSYNSIHCPTLSAQKYKLSTMGCRRSHANNATQLLWLLLLSANHQDRFLRDGEEQNWVMTNRKSKKRTNKKNNTRLNIYPGSDIAVVVSTLIGIAHVTEVARQQCSASWLLDSHIHCVPLHWSQSLFKGLYAHIPLLRWHLLRRCTCGRGPLEFSLHPLWLCSLLMHPKGTVFPLDDHSNATCMRLHIDVDSVGSCYYVILTFHRMSPTFEPHRQDRLQVISLYRDK